MDSHAICALIRAKTLHHQRLCLGYDPDARGQDEQDNDSDNDKNEKTSDCTKHITPP